MNENTEKLYSFLKANGYVDENLPIKSFEIKADIENPPSIKIEYDLYHSPYKAK